MNHHLFNSLKRRFKRTAFGWAPLILLYHRVAELDTDPQLLSVRPRNFAEHLDVLRGIGQVIPLSALISHRRDLRLRPKTFVITFDDGYKDNLHLAKPILESRDISATVFISTGHLERSQQFYWDALSDILLAPEDLSPGTDAHGNIGESRISSSDGEDTVGVVWSAHQAWNVQLPPPTPRHAAYTRLCSEMRTLGADEQAERIAVLRRTSGGKTSEPNDIRMSASEIRRLAEGGLIEVGAHTVSHSFLASLQPGAQHTEMANSKICLEQILDMPVADFSYPYGTLESYDASSVRAARECGFRCACSNFPGRVLPFTDRFQLPRVVVRDWDGEQFERFLAVAGF